MNVAGGSVHGDDAWPLPPIAIPRGLREHAWHGALLVSVLLLLLLPPLRPLAAAILLLIVVIRGVGGVIVAPWLLRRLAVVALGFSALLTWTRLEAGRSWSLLFDMAFRRTELGLLPPPERLVTEAWLWALALLTIATMAGFDLRVVNRQVVDERVWSRQRTRRRQVMAQHHRKSPPPETL